MESICLVLRIVLITEALLDLYILGRKESIKIIYGFVNWPPPEGRERGKMEAGHCTWAGGRVKKQGNLPGLPWVAAKRERLRTLQNLQSLYRSLNGFQMVTTTHCPARAVSLKAAPSVGMAGKREWGEEPPLAQIQLAGQPGVMTSQ